MKRIFQVIVLTGALFIVGLPVWAQGIQFLHDEPFDKVLQQAKEKNKLIFIDGYTVYCSPCKELDKKVFPLAAVGDYFNAGFINVKYDIDSVEGKKLQRRYKDVITGYPSLVLIDQDGNMIHKIGGFLPADSLIAKMKAAIAGHSLSSMRARFSAGEKSLPFMEEYMKMLADGYLREETESVKKALLERLSLHELIEPQYWKLAGSAVNDPYAPCFGVVVNNYFRFIVNKTTDINKLEFQLVTAIEQAMSDLLKAEEKNGRLQLKNEPEKEALLIGYMNTSDFRHAETVRAMGKIHDLKLAGQWRKMVDELALFHDIKSPGKSDAYLDESIQYMMQHCQDKQVLAIAVALLKTVQEEKKAGKNLYNENYYGTISRLYQLLGNQKEAEKYQRI
jgi:thioredoxin-related protein